jgi:Lamin Tail Domain
MRLTVRPWMLGLAGLLAACAAAGGSTTPLEVDPGGYTQNPLPPPRPPDFVNDGGALSAPARQSDGGQGGPRSGGGDDAGIATGDDASPAPGDDSGATSGDDSGTATGDDSGSGTAPPPCVNPLGAGDLAVVELMIASVQATGDQGEWLEIENTHPDCTLDVNGLHVATAEGVTADVTTDVYLPPNGYLVVADSTDPTVNNDLPGAVIGFANAPADALVNTGDTVTLSVSGTTIDSVTYPDYSNLQAGRSLSFPNDCAWTVRQDFTRWSFSFNAWTPGFQGTPNADNTDVSCY